MSSSVITLIPTLGVQGLVDYPDASYSKSVDVGSSHNSDTLWEHAPQKDINPDNLVKTARISAWRSLRVTINPGPGSTGRAISLMAGWGSSLSKPKELSDVTKLPGARQINLGGLQDAETKSTTIDLEFNHGLFSCMIKPTFIHNDFGYPVLYIWVQHAAGPKPLEGNLFRVMIQGQVGIASIPLTA